MNRMTQLTTLGLVCCALSANAMAQSTSPQQHEAAETEPINLLKYVGYYEFGDHHPIVVSYRTMEGGKSKFLMLTDLKTDAVRVLSPAGADRFTIGPELKRREPVVAQLHFQRAASSSGMRLEFAAVDSKRMVGDRLALQTEDIEYEHDGITYGATLYTPPGNGPAPGVLLVAGSGNKEADRYCLDAMPWVLANRGFVVLAFDKRGMGASGGHWDIGLELRAEDGAGALNALRRQSRVDQGRVGILGFSEGAWVAPMTARIDGNVAFVVQIGGGGGTIADVTIFQHRNRHVEAGKTGEELEGVMANLRGLHETAKRNAESGQASGFDLRMLHDPGDVWESFEGSMLAILGEMDVLQDSIAGADWTRAALEESKCVDWQVKVFPSAHHPMFQGKTGLPSEFSQMRGISHFVPGYWSTLILWLEERFGN